MPEVIVTLIITLFIAVMVHNRRLNPAVPEETRGKLVINLSYIISMAVFVSVTGAVTMLIDKPTYRSQLEKNSNYFNYVPTNAVGSLGDYEDMTQSSSPRYGANSYTNEPLFYFETDGNAEEYFLRRQAYDTFDGSVWNVSENYQQYARVYSSTNLEYMTDDIITAMQSIAQSGIDLVGAEFTDDMLRFTSGHVYDDSFKPVYLPAPYATVMDGDSFSESNYIKYPHGEIYRKSALSENGSAVLDDSYHFYEQEDDFYRYVVQLGLRGSDYTALLDNAVESGVPLAEDLLADYQSACELYTDSGGISDEITELAKEITADCDSDIEKASALEQYFENNGFVYDTEYVPPDESIEYFLFEGKTGVCSSYATAMTLMARAVGLPARYVEGFAAFERTDSGAFVVRDSYAHAFVEVYIPGAGWMTFDPTVSGYMQIPDDSNFSTSTFFAVLGRLLVVIAVAFVIVFIVLLDRIVEMFFRVRLHFMNPREKTLRLYANVIKLVNFSAQSDYSSYTVKMLREYLYESRGAVPERLFSLFEKTCFGGYDPSDEEFNSAYAEYKNCYKRLRKIPKPKTAKA
jgi:transglutaminase-like putative cysteine protease